MTLLGIVLLLSGLTLALTILFRILTGQGLGKVISYDETELVSKTLHLKGRPDRLERIWGRVIPVEKKSSKTLQDSHRAQVLVYCLLVEEVFGLRPPYGIVVLGTGRRVRVWNTNAAREKIFQAVRVMRKALSDENFSPMATPSPGKCSACFAREQCRFRMTTPVVNS